MSKAKQTDSSKVVTLPPASDEKLTKARGILQNILGKTAINFAQFTTELNAAMQAEENARQTVNKVYGDVGEHVFNIRRMFLEAKLTTWDAFTHGNPPYEDCGLQSVTGISRSSAMNYLALFTSRQALPDYVSAIVKTAIAEKLGSTRKAVQLGHVVSFLASAEGKKYVTENKASTPEEGVSFVNQLTKELRETRANREEKTTLEQLTSAIVRVYLHGNKKEPDVKKATGRLDYAIGLERMLSDLASLKGSISAIQRYHASITVDSGNLPEHIRTLETSTRKAVVNE